MFDLSTITRETRSRAPKGIVYGPPGVGKSTFGASTGGLILDAENGLPAGIDVAHTPYYATWPEMKDCLDYLANHEHGFTAVVVDTVDWMLRRIEEHVSGVSNGLDNTLNKAKGGYGNGKQVLKNYAYQYLLPVLDKIVNRGVAVVLLAHATRRDLTALEGSVSERSMPQIHADLAETMIEWSDFVGAACLVGGVRSLVLQETPQLVAKNRYGIDKAVYLSWDALTAEILNNMRG